MRCASAGVATVDHAPHELAGQRDRDRRGAAHEVARVLGRRGHDVVGDVLREADGQRVVGA